MSFLSRSAGSAPLSPEAMKERKEQVMNEVRQQLSLANAQELVNKMNDKCFVKCITKPSGALTPSEEGCIARCSDRFLEAFNVISQRYVSRLGREREAANIGQLGGGMGGEGLH